MVRAQTFERYSNRYKRDQQRHGQFVLLGGMGISSYLGDLKSAKFSLDAKPNVILGVKYRYKTHLSYRGEFSWYRISGADANQPIESGLPSRNLSFRSDNFEINTAAILHAFPRYKTKRDLSPVYVNPYLFLGLGASTNNPTAEYEGRRYNLRRMETQGVTYSGIILVIPAGLGFDFRINDKFDVGLEAGYRFTITDQLDDSSLPETLHADHFLNPISAALADRRAEVGIIPGAPDGAGSIRGNPNRNDSYFLISIKGQYYIPMTGLRRAKTQGQGTRYRGPMKRGRR